MSTDNQNFKTAVMVATITLMGTLGTAIITNWDKLFSSQPHSISKLTPLENLLENKKWVEADLATDALQPAALSCSDLSSINKLWLKYSDNNFGYSVQRKIWQQRNLHNKYADFAEFVGWKHDNRYAFNIRDPLIITDPDAPTKAPLGHLPFNGWQVEGVIRRQFDNFMLKLGQCNI
ncbi:MAG: GUN4 domain-containing protein [Nostoc sp.]|uniref:GUN4 domain-containing protein n=1 Tax=Nostoc sp. TaxID=1180 RepID=UPI002FF6AAF5